MPYYLMRFDRSTLAEPAFEEFFDADEAHDHLDAAEREAPANVDVVLFSARSVDALRTTHSSYFKGRRQRERRGTGRYANTQRAWTHEVAEPVDV